MGLSNDGFASVDAARHPHVDDYLPEYVGDVVTEDAPLLAATSKSVDFNSTSGSSHDDRDRDAAAQKNHVKQQALGVFLLLVASLGFGSMHLLVRIGTSTKGMPVALYLFARGAISGAIPAVFILAAGVGRLSARNAAFLAARGLTGGISMFCKYQAVSRLPLTEATAVLFTSPAITIIFARVFLGEPIEVATVAACLCTFGGVLTLALSEPAAPAAAAAASADAQNVARLVGVAYGLLASLMQAVSYTATRWLGNRMHSQYNVLSLGVWSAVLGLVALGKDTPRQLALSAASTTHTLLLVGTGLCAYVGASAVNRSLQLLGAGSVSVLRAVDLPVNVALGYLFLNESHFSRGSVVGTLVVGLSSLALGYVRCTKSGSA